MTRDEERRMLLSVYPDRKIHRYAMGADSPKAAAARSKRAKKQYKTEARTHTQRGVNRRGRETPVCDG